MPGVAPREPDAASEKFAVPTGMEHATISRNHPS
jgi:hypothetical protein